MPEFGSYCNLCLHVFRMDEDFILHIYNNHKVELDQLQVTRDFVMTLNRFFVVNPRLKTDKEANEQ